MVLRESCFELATQSISIRAGHLIHRKCKINLLDVVRLQESDLWRGVMCEKRIECVEGKHHTLYSIPMTTRAL